MATANDTRPDALLWIDVETTGPDRATAQLLEIGMACTDQTATRDYGRLHTIVRPGTIDLARISLWAWDVHTANGLLDEVRKASTMQHGPAAVANAVEEYLESLQQRFHLVPTGTNVGFDLAFLERLGIDLSGLSYRKFDMSAIRRLITILGGPDPYRNDGSLHRVEDCLDRDITDYRHYLRLLQIRKDKD